MASKSSPTDLQLSLATQIAEKIIREKTAEDTRLKEGDLASEFGVSRSPIRGALALLEDREVVRSVPNHGYYLAVPGTKLNLKDLGLGETEEDALYSSIVGDRVKKVLGDVETEADLMRRYNVTRSQLLRTLNRLSTEGILERSQGYGWRFLPALDSEKAHDESYAFRLLIEPASFAQSTFKADTDELEACKTAHLELMNSKVKRVSAAALFEINASFHEMIAKFSGNRFIHQAVQQQNRLRRLLEYRGFHDADRVRHSCEEHLEIMAAIERGDLEWASSLLHRHLKVASQLKLSFQELA